MEKQSENLFIADAMKTHQKGILSLLKFKMNNAHDAEDVMQEMWIKFTKAYRLGKYNEEQNLKHYLGTIAFNCMRDFWRKGKKMSIDYKDIFPDIIDNDGKELEDKLVYLQQCINKMGEGQLKSCAQLRYDGYSYDETAKLIGCSRGAVGSYIYKAKIQLLKIYLKFENFS